MVTPPVDNLLPVGLSTSVPGEALEEISPNTRLLVLFRLIVLITLILVVIMIFFIKRNLAVVVGQLQR